MTLDKALQGVASALRDKCKELKGSPEEVFGRLIRQAIDEVVDGPRTGRFSLAQLTKVEKTYVGTKVEIILRSTFGLEKGRHDIRIEGKEVDIKWSRTMAWMIGPENVGQICLGLGLSRGEERFSVGLFRPTRELLRKGANRDAKLGLSSQGRGSAVVWLVENATLPPDFFATLPPRIRDRILNEPVAQEAVKALANLVPMVPIPRRALETAAKGRFDPLRRTRRDKYRTAPLGGMRLLSTKYFKKELVNLGITDLPKGCWVAVPEKELGS